MHLTIHIGPHKTGTTALQTAFAVGSGKLRKAGVVYPRSNWLYPAQHRLAFALKDQRIPGTNDHPDREREVHDLMAAIAASKCQKAFLSSEEFFACPPSAIAWLRHRLDLDHVEILTFLRRPDTFLVSSYGQKMRQPGNGFDAPIQRFVRNPRQIAPEIDYRTCVQAWADAFGDDRVLLKTYEAGRPLMAALQQLGLSPDFLPDDPTVNKSPPGPVIETMRHAKAIGLSPDRQRRLLNIATEVYANREHFFLSTEDRLSIVRAFEDDNSALFRRFGQDNPYTLKKFTPVPGIRDHNLSHTDLLYLVDRLL